MAELFIKTDFNGLGIYPNPRTQAESGWRHEVGIKQGLKHFNWMGFVDIGWILMEYDDMMEFSFGFWGPTNAGGLGLNQLT